MACSRHCWVPIFGVGRPAAAALTSAILVALTVFVTAPAQAQTFTILHSFSYNGSGGGNYPYAGVNLIAGSLYGTASQGGQFGYGTVFELNHRGSGWVLQTLHSFAGGSDGAYPWARVAAGPGGILYGTTGGGGNGYGTVFSLRLHATACLSAVCPWIETVLYRFQGGSDGGYPCYADDLAFDHAGNIYGTTTGDTNGNDGTIFELSPSNGGWTETILHRFTNQESPCGGVTFDTAGNLYGTTFAGGIGYGTVYELTPSGSGWVYHTIYEFQGTGGSATPIGGVTFDTSGNLYGTTAANGGTVYEMQPSNGGWAFTVIYNNIPTCNGPADTPTVDAAGNVYGTVLNECSNLGFVFKLTPSGGGWTETTLVVFGAGNNNAEFPYDSVVVDANGNVYGTTLAGGSGATGTVWEITP